MQHAWRFVDDAFVRERLRKPRALATPATRFRDHRLSERKQGFLIAQEAHRSDRDGLSLFGVFSTADPALGEPRGDCAP